MIKEDPNREIERLFELLRQEDQRCAPTLHELLVRKVSPYRRWGIWYAPAVALVLLALAVPLTKNWLWLAPPAAEFADSADLFGWRSPTEFLLEMPGAELSTTVPLIDLESNFWSTVEDHQN